MDALAFFFVEGRSLASGAFKHALGKVEARDALAHLRERHGDAAGAATQFQYGIAVLARGVAIKGDVLRALAHERRFVVVVRDERIVQGGRQVFFVDGQGARSLSRTKASVFGRF